MGWENRVRTVTFWKLAGHRDAISAVKQSHVRSKSESQIFKFRCRVWYYSHAPHNDVSVNDGYYNNIMGRWSHNIITIHPTLLQLPTVFSTATCCTDCEVREKTNKMQQLDVYFQQFLNMFRASLCPSSGEQRPYVTACGVLRWFCWMWLVAVVGRCVVGCEHCEGYCSHPTTQRPTTATFTVLAPHNTAPHNRYQPHPAEPAQHTTCNNIRSLFSWRWT